MKKAKYHIVKESVEHAKSKHGRYVANFVNAVLRKYVREYESISQRPLPDISLVNDTNDSPAGQAEIKHLSIVYSFPEWLVKRWFKRFGHDATEKLLDLLNKPPEFGIRVNLGNISRDETMNRLTAKGINVKKGRYTESALSVDKLIPVLKDELFMKGLIHIQDETSQLVGASILQKKGGAILDACAGLGTKTEQLIEQGNGATIIAMDIEMKRLKLISGTAGLVKGDAVSSPFRENSFSAILLDAPCSSLGIIRKHPEIKWRRRERDIVEFGKYQLKLLKALWKILKPGGYMVYSVCSFEPEETISIVERFKKEETFTLENPFPFLFNKEYFLSLPHETGMDGFFITRLRKK